MEVSVVRVTQAEGTASLMRRPDVLCVFRTRQEDRGDKCYRSERSEDSPNSGYWEYGCFLY